MPSEKISAMPQVNSTSANDIYLLVQAGVNSSITFSKLQSAIVAGATAGGYTPANPSKWVSPAPTTIQEALDRIAAVVGSSVPIP